MWFASRCGLLEHCGQLVLRQHPLHSPRDGRLALLLAVSEALAHGHTALVASLVGRHVVAVLIERRAAEAASEDADHFQNEAIGQSRVTREARCWSATHQQRRQQLTEGRSPQAQSAPHRHATHGSWSSCPWPRPQSGPHASTRGKLTRSRTTHVVNTPPYLVVSDPDLAIQVVERHDVIVEGLALGVPTGSAERLCSVPT